MGDFFRTVWDNIPYIYFALISLIAFIITAYDKYASRHKTGKRIPELRLFLTAAIGGAIFMLATMLVIRHKTQHKRFMIGLPIIIAIQFALILGILIWF